MIGMAVVGDVRWTMDSGSDDNGTAIFVDMMDTMDWVDVVDWAEFIRPVADLPKIAPPRVLPARIGPMVKQRRPVAYWRRCGVSRSGWIGPVGRKRRLGR